MARCRLCPAATKTQGHRNTGTSGNEEERHETQVDLGPRCTNIDRVGQFHHTFDWVGFGSLVWFKSYNFKIESRHGMRSSILVELTFPGTFRTHCQKWHGIPWSVQNENRSPH
jgi:hypothetical protein